MSARPLTVVTHARWRAAELAEHIAVRHDFGLDLDAAADPAAVLWCPGAWAAAATMRYPHLRLSSAGPGWLDGLTPALTGRDIRTYTAAELAGTAADALPGRVFAKLPETKHERFEAKVRDVAALAGKCALLPGDEPVQVQTPVEFLYELRCWLRRGEVVAHSVYMPGVDRERWTALGNPDRDTEGLRWLRGLLAAGDLELPAAAVLDIGWCADPVSGRPGWRIVEANAAWSADWYCAEDIGAVFSTIAAAQFGVSDRWLWRPSPLLVNFTQGLLRR